MKLTVVVLSCTTTSSDPAMVSPMIIRSSGLSEDACVHSMVEVKSIDTTSMDTLKTANFIIDVGI